MLPPIVNKHVQNNKINNISLNSQETKDSPTSRTSMSFESLQKSRANSNSFNYQMGEKIADGSSSIVYRALNLRDGSIFAIKKYHSCNDVKLLETFNVIIIIKLPKQY
jgi:hypothetical protein